MGWGIILLYYKFKGITYRRGNFMAIKKSKSKNLKRAGAIAGAAITLLTLAGCSTNNQTEQQTPQTDYQQTLNEQQAQIDALKELIEQMKDNLDQANQDIADLNNENLVIKDLIQRLMKSTDEKLTNLTNQVAGLDSNLDGYSENLTDITTELNSTLEDIGKMKEGINSLQNSNVESVKNIESLESLANKLSVQISILQTCSRYNKIEIINPQAESITINSNINGSYVENESDRIAYYDVENSLWYNSNNNEIGHAPTRFQNYILTALQDFDSVTRNSQGDVYSLSSSKYGDSAMVYTTNSGDIYNITYSGNFYYGLTGETHIEVSNSTKAEYEQAVVDATSKIPSYTNYQNYIETLDSTFDADYIGVDVVQQGVGDDGEGKAVISNGKVGLSVDAGEIQQAVVVENGVQKIVYTDENGEAEAYEMEANGNYLNILKNSLTTEGVFGMSDFTITFDDKNQEYVITSDYNGTSLRANFKLDGNGELESIKITQTYENGETFVASYGLTELNKSQFNQAFEEIKAKYDELIKNIDNHVGV